MKRPHSEISSNDTLTSAENVQDLFEFHVRCCAESIKNASNTLGICDNGQRFEITVYLEKDDFFVRCDKANDDDDDISQEPECSQPSPNCSLPDLNIEVKEEKTDEGISTQGGFSPSLCSHLHQSPLSSDVSVDSSDMFLSSKEASPICCGFCDNESIGTLRGPDSSGGQNDNDTPLFSCFTPFCANYKEVSTSLCPECNFKCMKLSK